MISSKFQPPAPPPGLVRRGRLLHLLHGHVGQPLVVVAAPPGYGKTTLAADWASDVDLRVCWLTLERWDREAQPFLTSIQGAVAATIPEPALHLAAFADDPPRAAHLLAESLAAADDYTVVVLDDYHLVDGAPAPRAFLEALLEATSGSFQVMLLGRGRPSLAGLGRLSARHQALLLGAADLAFTDEEVRELFRNLYREDLPLEEAAALARRSEGWAAALLLGRAADAGAGFESLAAEALAALPARIGRFLLHISPLPFLTPGLCDAVLGGERSERLLKEAASLSSFVVAADSAATSYRCHQLFRSYLQQRFAADAPAAFARTCQRAARALQARGYALEAVSLLVEANAWRAAASSLLATGDELIGRGYGAATLALLDSLPPEAVTPAVRLLRGRLLLEVQRVDEALVELQRVLAQEPDSIADGVRCEIARGQALGYKGHHAAADDAFQSALHRAGFLEEGRSSVLRAEALRRLGISRARQGRVAEAVPDLEEAREIFDLLGRTSEYGSTCNTLSFCHSQLGDRPAALRALEQARSAAERLGNRHDLAAALNNAGILQLEIGEFEAGLGLFARAADAARTAGDVVAEAYAIAGIAEAELGQGLVGEAAQHYETALALARPLDDAYLLAAIHRGRVLANLRSGNVAAARLLLPLALDRVSQHERLLLDGRIALAGGNFAAALQSFERAAVDATAAGAQREAAVHFVLAGVAAHNLRRFSHSRRALESAARICAELGYSRFLLPEVRDHQQTLALVATRGIATLSLLPVLQEARQHPRAVPHVAPVDGTGASAVEAWALGTATVQVAGGEVSDTQWRSEKAREMFFFLLLGEGARTKEHIFSALWPELPPSKCNSNFHSTLHRLRRAVGASAVLTARSQYRLDRDRVRYFDVAHFRDSLRAAATERANPQERLRLLRDALDAYRGPFLPACYSEWAEDARRGLERLYARALAETAALEERQGLLADAFATLERLSQLDPYAEQPVLAMMRCQRSLGDPEAALVVYRRFAALLYEELDAAPSHRLAALADEIAAASPTS